ncbi:unnamed protein product, partial [Protopolystoma xenopodis]
LHTSSGGGFCDCGDVEAWRQDPFCRRHSPSVSASMDQSSNDTPGDVTEEMVRLRSRLFSLPDDIACRAGVLFRPLLNSIRLCLLDLVQVI